VAATKGARAAFASHDTEESFITVVHFLAHTGPVDCHDLATTINHGTFPTALAKTLQATGAFDSVTVTQIMDHGDPTPPSQDTEACTVAGAFTPGSTDLPRNLTGLCRLRSNVSGRGTHGWIYGFPIKATANVTPATGVLTGGYNTQLQAMATTLNTVLSVSGALDTYDLAVFSRARWARGETKFLFSVTAAVAGTKYKVLRKRDLEPGL